MHRYLIALVVFLVPFTVEAQSSNSSFKICLGKNKNTLSSRKNCIKGETTLSLTALARKINELETDETTFTAVEEQGTTVPAATSNPSSGTTPGNLQVTATCTSGLVVASSCFDSVDNPLSITRGESAAGNSVTCTWSNSITSVVTGVFTARAVCGVF